MPKTLNQKPGPVSIDEFLSERKDFVAPGDILMKGMRSAPSWDPEKRSARFTMSAEVEDRDRDIITVAGIDTADFEKNPTLLYGHSWGGFPVGVWEDVEKNLTGRPKRMEGTAVLMPADEDEDADRVAVHMNRGTLKTCSIGFIPKKAERRARPEGVSEWYYPGYMILECELVECSIVKIPSNRASLVKGGGQDGSTYSLMEIEEILDTWVKTPSGLVLRRERAEQAYEQLFGSRKAYFIGLDRGDPPPATPVETVAESDKSVVTVVEKTAGEVAGEAVEQELTLVADWWKEPQKPQPTVKHGLLRQMMDTVAKAFIKQPTTPPVVVVEPIPPAETVVETKFALADPHEWAVAKAKAIAVLQ